MFLLPAVQNCFTQIQSRIWTCRQAYTTVSCHCGVAVREGNDVVSIDQCFWQQRDPETKIFNIPPRVRKHSTGPLQRGFGVYKNPSGTQYKVGIYYTYEATMRRYSRPLLCLSSCTVGTFDSSPIKYHFFQIQLPSGAAVKVDANYWGMSIYVRVAEDDHGKTRGLCGNNNGDKGDDMIGSDEVLYAKDPGSIAKKAFVDTWRFAFNFSNFLIFIFAHRVSENENLFSSDAVKAIVEEEKTDEENDLIKGRFCDCQKHEGLTTCPDFDDPIEIIKAKAFAGNQWTEVGQDLKSKRAVAGPDDVPTDEDNVDDDYDFVFDPTAEPPVFQFPTPNNITERAAVDECNRVLTASPVAKACIEEGVIDTISNDTIASCVEDIKVSCVAIFFSFTSL